MIDTPEEERRGLAPAGWWREQPAPVWRKAASLTTDDAWHTRPLELLSGRDLRRRPVEPSSDVEKDTERPR